MKKTTYDILLCTLQSLAFVLLLFGATGTAFPRPDKPGRKPLPATKPAEAVQATLDRNDFSGTEFVVTKCERWGEHVAIRFQWTNRKNDDMNIYVDDCTCKVTGPDGQKYAVSLKIGRGDDSRYESRTVLPGGVPVKGTVMVHNVPEGLTVFSDITLVGYCNFHANRRTICLKNVEVGPANSRDAVGNVHSTLPTLQGKVWECKRTGSSVTVHFSLTNQGDTSHTLTGMSIKAYDEEGNEYVNLRGTLDNRSFSATASHVFEPGEERRGTVVIKNVPSQIREMSLVRLSYTMNGVAYKLEIRNQPVTR